MSNILQIAQDVADDIKLVRPASLFTSDDQTAADLLRALHRVGRHLNMFWDWPSLRFEKTFTSISGAQQTNSVDANMLRILPGTMFDRTNHVRILGPLSANEWQERIAITTVAIRPAFMLRGTGVSSIYLSTPNAAGATIAYEYIVKRIGFAVDGTTPRVERFTTDTDTPIWSDELMHLGMAWAVNHREGMFNNPDYEAFKARVNDEINQAAVGDVLSLTPTAWSELEISIPEGNWAIT